MWCLSYPPSARRDRPISLARSRRAPRPQSNASDHLRQCRHDASAIERYGRLSDLPPPKDAQPANEVEWKRPRMCTGERTRELHSGPARAGGGLTRRESLASSTANAGIVSKCDGRHNPADQLRLGSGVLVRELVGFLPRLAERRSSELLLQEPPAPAYAAEPSVAPRNTADDQRQSPWFCTANALICFTKPFTLAPKPDSWPDLFLRSLTEAMPRT